MEASVEGSGRVRGKFERTEEAGQEEEAEAREEEGGEEEMVPAPRRVTNLELGMYALLGIFCLAIIFLVNRWCLCCTTSARSPPNGALDPDSPQPYNCMWLGTDQEDLGRQLDRQPPGPIKGGGDCPCESGAGDPDPGTPSTLARKEAGGRQKRVEFMTFAPVPSAQLLEEPVAAPAVQSTLVAARTSAGCVRTWG
ncbi:Transmembrane protein 132A [Myotis davidii]|uniref:Transmembrane protein 132A n=1 Tax=Myotis davidii TaxID=225400 RepID=L5M6X3_MYODS|nr:Transmembrane protein 132A [Myotis davidii]